MFNFFFTKVSVITAILYPIYFISIFTHHTTSNYGTSFVKTFTYSLACWLGCFIFSTLLKLKSLGSDQIAFLSVVLEEQCFQID